MSSAFRLGLFIILGLLILVAGVFLIGEKQSMFKSTYLLKANFPTVAGLNNGADVRVGGVHEGTVRRIQLPQHPSEQVVVVMDLERPTRSIVKKDSVASILSEGLVGDKYVDVSFGSEGSPEVQNGDTIQSLPPADLAKMIEKADRILDTTQGAVESLDSTADQVEAIASKINQGKGTIGALVNDKSVYNEAAAGAASFRDDMEALKHNFLLRGFFHNRGYEDAEELTKYEIAKMPSERSTRTFSYDARKLFDKDDSGKLKNERLLREAGQFLQDEPFGYAVVAASTGLTGDSKKQQILTEARTLVVRNYLAENFRLDDSRIRTIGLGKTGVSQIGGDKVAILIYSSGLKPPALKPEAAINR